MNSVIALTSAQRRELFNAAAQELGYTAPVVEKDFWVCWTLRELFALPGAREHLIFKGGTALSKIWRAIRRFSEDVDVSLSREWLGFTGKLDPKGFWRVDKDQPPELRQTVLAQVAFHDLQAMGLEAFLAQNNGEGWMLPESLRLSDYGLGHDDRARQPQPVASQFGNRFLPWQLNEDVAQSWDECRRHAENIRVIRSRFAPEPAAAAPSSTPPAPQAPSKPPALDLLGQPIPTDLFGVEITPRSRRHR